MDIIRRCAAAALALLLLAAGCAVSTEPTRLRTYKPPGDLPEQTDEGLSDDALLDALLADYERYGLPMPPANARLAVWDLGRYLVWFDPDAATGDQMAVWVGFGTTLAYSDLTLTAPSPRLLADPDLVGMVRFDCAGAVECSNLLPLTVQAWSRGHQEFARALLARVRADEAEPWRIRLRALLADAAWTFWEYELRDVSADRAVILTHLEALHGNNARLADASRECRGDLVKDLRLTVLTPPAPAGSPDALIDALVTYKPAARGFFTFSDPPYRAILAQGFGAVPLLINHLDDDRLTHMPREVGKKTGLFRCVCVSEVVRDLLSDLATPHFGRSRTLSHDEIEAWWRQAQAQGEEAYLLANVLYTGQEGPTALSRTVLQMLSLRYPQHLPGVYGKALAESPQVGTWYLVELLAQADLPLEQKADALLAGARHADLKQRKVAIMQLFELDHPQAAQLLIEGMREIPDTPEGPYRERSGPDLCQLACLTGDDEVWQALLATARRVDIGQRMEILYVMSYTGLLDNRQLDRRIELLTAFLDDAAVRDVASNKAKYSGCAGAQFDRLAVRDLVALRLANLLEMDYATREPESHRPKQEWPEFRESVRHALAERARRAT